MSGLYNGLFGPNEQTGFLLGIVGLNNYDLGRFRAIYVTNEHVVVHTRNGGGNRDDYQYVFDLLEKHPLYAYDEDDDFDCTYANIYFRHPEGYEDILAEMAKDTVTPAEKWQMLFAALAKK